MQNPLSWLELTFIVCLLTKKALLTKIGVVMVIGLCVLTNTIVMITIGSATWIQNELEK